MEDDWGYVTIWEFYVQAGNERRFEQSYGPEGEWVQLFKAGEGYCGTELNRDFKIPRRYVTLDFWTSQAAYTRFREINLDRYEALDGQCEQLTERETEIGSFNRVSPA